MTDIVERLRKASVYEEYKAVLSNLGDEAADEIERLRSLSDPATWHGVFDAQKSIIGMLVETLREIKRNDRHYNFGSKLNRIVDEALGRLPPSFMLPPDQP